jgi:uncharacterized membrane protein HdeD (DUF308 family)
MADSQSTNAASQVSKWMKLYGLGMLLLGSAAILAPFFSSVFISIYVGWLFLFAGVLRLVQAYQTRQDLGGALFRLLIGVLYLCGGAFLIWDPIEGTFWLTYCVGLLFVVEGIAHVLLGLLYRKNLPHWGWILGDGLITFSLGFMVLARWPDDALWTLGLLAGLSLISSGWTALMFNKKTLGTLMGV